MTQDEQVFSGARPAAPAARDAATSVDAPPAESDLGDSDLVDDEVDARDRRDSAQHFVRIQSSVFAVGLTIGAVLLLALVAGNVYQFLHQRSDATIATVNGAAITQTDFDRAAGSGDQALQSLIDQRLIQQEAKKQKVAIPDSEVNAEINTIKQQLGSPTEFAAALKRANLTERQLHDQIRTQKLAQAMGAKGVTVTDDEAQTYYSQNKAQFGSQTFDQTKDQIKGQLLQSKQNEAIQTWIAGLRQKAKISVHMPA